MRNATQNDAICLICNKRFNKLISSPLKTHGITSQDYSNLFGRNDSSCVSCSYPANSSEESKCKLAVQSENEFCILYDDN